MEPEPASTVVAPDVVQTAESLPSDEEAIQPSIGSMVVDDESGVTASATVDNGFDYNLPAAPTKPSEEAAKPAFPGDKDFDAAVSALPPVLREKLKETLGAEFTALRSVSVNKLRRPK